MTSSYGLYQTLVTDDIPSKKLVVAKRELMMKKMQCLNMRTTEAVFMIIYEWAKLNDDFERDGDVLPYNMTYKDGNVTFDIEVLPSKLQWVLWRFCSLIKDEE